MGDREKQSPEGQIHGPQFRVEVGDLQEVGPGQLEVLRLPWGEALKPLKGEALRPLSGPAAKPFWLALAGVHPCSGTLSRGAHRRLKCILGRGQQKASEMFTRSSNISSPIRASQHSPGTEATAQARTHPGSENHALQPDVNSISVWARHSKCI